MQTPGSGSLCRGEGDPKHSARNPYLECTAYGGILNLPSPRVAVHIQGSHSLTLHTSCCRKTPGGGPMWHFIPKCPSFRAWPSISPPASLPTPKRRSAEEVFGGWGVYGVWGLRRFRGKESPKNNRAWLRVPEGPHNRAYGYAKLHPELLEASCRRWFHRRSNPMKVWALTGFGVVGDEV